MDGTWLIIIIIVLCILTFVYFNNRKKRKLAKQQYEYNMATFTFCNTLTDCGQNGLKEGNYFLLLKDKKAISLNTYENGKIDEQNTFAITEKSIFATDQKERVAILEPAQNSIILYEIQTSEEIKLSIPYDIEPKCILLNNENVFVGGRMGKEMLVQYHIQSETWYNLKIPRKVSLFGKAVDDLLIKGNFLIAIDNIVIPKFLLIYKLNSTGKLEFSHSRMLKSNSSYECISQGRITPKYLGLISSTINDGTDEEHITIYADLNLVRSFAISVEVGRKRNFNDFLLIENKLFIANRKKGLGVFEIKDSYFKGSKDGFDIFNENERVSENEVNYKQYKNGEIIRLTTIPNELKIILTIRNKEGEISHEIVNVECSKNINH